MLDMGRDHERQEETGRSHDLSTVQKVGLSGWARDDPQSFVVGRSCPGMRVGGPDLSQWCLSWTLPIWEHVLKIVVEDMEKREGCSKLLKKGK